MISVDDLLRLAAAGPDRLAKLGDLAARLATLDQERASILAELAECGIAAADLPRREPEKPGPWPPVRRSEPPCSVCGEEASETVDDVWYCQAHGTAAVTLA